MTDPYLRASVARDKKRAAYEAAILLEFIKERLDYEPATGLFKWRARSDVPKSWNTRRAGKVAGTRDADDYVYIWLNGRRCTAHRIAWALTTGTWPAGMLDHKNRNKSDNRIDNLREATPAQNMQNTTPRKATSSGKKGVCWRKQERKWVARIIVDGKQIFLGLFDDVEAAHNKYKEASGKYFGEFAHNGDAP